MQQYCVVAQDSEMPPETPHSVWTLTDGRPGNLNPARALARALEAHGWAPAEDRTATLRPWAARLPAGVWVALGAREGGWPFTGLSDRGAGVARPWPDLVISAGRRSAPIAAAMRRLSGGAVRAVQILDPGLSPARFDAVVVPEHDRLTGPNVLRSLGSLSAVTPATAAEAAARETRFTALPRPRAAVLLGGPSRSARFGEAEGRAVVAAVRALAEAGWTPLVTPSRRTPAGLAAEIARAVPSASVWDGGAPNPYPALLGAAELALVTADSANMASEAASAGLPVLVLDLPGLAPKLRRFHAALRERRCSRIFRGEPETWEAPPLDEAARVGAEVAVRLGGGYTTPRGFGRWRWGWATRAM